MTGYCQNEVLDHQIKITLSLSEIHTDHNCHSQTFLAGQCSSWLPCGYRLNPELHGLPGTGLYGGLGGGGGGAGNF